MRIVEANARAIAELNGKLDAIIKHQNAPSKPMGFVEE